MTSAARSGSRSSGRHGVQLAPEDALDLRGLCLPRRGQPARHGARLVLDQHTGAPHASDALVEARPLPGELLDALRQRQAGVDRHQRRHHALVLLARDGLEERLAIGEVLEHGALGHAGPGGDLGGRRLRLPFVQQAEQGLHQRLACALGPDGPAVALLGGGAHRGHCEPKAATCGIESRCPLDSDWASWSTDPRDADGTQRAKPEVVRLAAPHVKLRLTSAHLKREVRVSLIAPASVGAICISGPVCPISARAPPAPAWRSCESGASSSCSGACGRPIRPAAARSRRSACAGSRPRRRPPRRGRRAPGSCAAI